MREVEAAACDAPAPKRAMTKEEANAEAMRLAKRDPSFVHKTQRQWAKAIGCSVGLVARLPLWKQVMERTDRGRGKGKPRAVGSLTPEVLATAHAAEPEEVLHRLAEEEEVRHKELQQTIEEQQRDDRPQRTHKRL
jgi:hypothetical protein